ncbi:hypothetical protein HDV05_003968 [Chytridiales sp. JEL 0842]|nr:hypothetical protein HDV05_003968 [Chytridiales sp. JEL 0842]
MVVNAGGNAVAGWGGLKVGENQRLRALEGKMLWVPPEAVAATFMGIPPEEVAKMRTEEGEIQMDSVDADEVVATKLTQIAFKDNVKGPPAMRRRSGIDRSTSAKEEGLPVDPSIKPMSYAAIAAKSTSQSSPTRVVSPTTGAVVHEPSSSPSLSCPAPTKIDNIIEPIPPPHVISPLDSISTKMVRKLSSESEKEAWQSSSLDRQSQQNGKQRQSVQTFTSEKSEKSVGAESTNSDILNKMPLPSSPPSIPAQDTKPLTKNPSESKQPSETPPTPPPTPTIASTTTSTKKPKPVSTTILPTYIPTHLTIHPFTVTHADELPITNGDLIHVSEVFADGWGKGVNLSKGKRVGMVPMGCLKEVRGVKGCVETAEGSKENRSANGSAGSPRASGEGGLLLPIRAESLYV